MIQKVLVVCLIFALISCSTAQWGYNMYGGYPGHGYGYGNGMYGPMGGYGYGMSPMGHGAMSGAMQGARIGASLGALGGLLGKK